MVNANVTLLKEFISTIRCVCEEKELRQQFSVTGTAFSRNRKLNFSAVTFIILSMLRKSLNIELQHFFEQTLCDSIEPCSKSAFCQQRQKISSEWFRFLLEYIAGLLYEQSSLVKKWKGNKIISIDGSAAFLVNKQEVKDYYKGGFNQYGGYALARYMKMYDVLNGLTLKAQLMPFDGAERLVSYNWVDYIPNGAITLFDRGFPSYTLFFLMHNSEQSKSFVMRCKKDFSNTVIKFAASDSKEDMLSFYAEDRTVNILRSHGFIVKPKTAIHLRAVKVLLADGSTEILLTNLFDKKQFRLEDLAKLYRMRWQIETDIGKEKNLFQLENFSSHTRNSIEQDFYATFITANIHQLIAKKANIAIQKTLKNRKYSYQINTSASLHVFKKNLARLYYTKDLKQLLLHLQKVFERFIEPIRPERKIARIKRTRRRYGKHQTQTNYRNNL